MKKKIEILEAIRFESEVNDDLILSIGDELGIAMSVDYNQIEIDNNGLCRIIMKPGDLIVETYDRELIVIRGRDFKGLCQKGIKVRK